MPSLLVVDDVEDNRELYRSYFAHCGYRVDDAANGEEAMEKIAREQPAVIIMDLSMPVLDGWEATRRLKSDPKTAKIPIIVLSGFATPSDMARAKAAGADRVLTKPCLPQKLLAIVKDLLES